MNVISDFELGLDQSDGLGRSLIKLVTNGFWALVIFIWETIYFLF